MEKRKVQNRIFFLLKILVFIAAWWYVYYKITHMSENVFLLFTDFKFTWLLISILSILMVGNWLLEILKWNLLVNKIQKISFYTACKGVLVGLPLALVTPNRIGEIGGRSLVVTAHKKKTMFATFIGSLMQLLTTVLFGIIGFILYLLYLKPDTFLSILALSSIIGVIIIAVYIFLLRKMRWVLNISLKILGRSYYRKIVTVSRMYFKRDIFITLLISIGRYIIFSTQFLILLYVFIPELSVLEIFVGICIVYFIVTVIPTSILGEVGIRGSVAMVVFGLFTTQELLVFQVSLLIWLINIVIPTLLGTLILIGIKKGEKS